MNNISMLIITLTLCTGLAFYRFAKPVSLRLIVLLMAVTLVVELSICYLVSIKHIYQFNNPTYNLFSFFDQAIWFYVFYKIHAKSKIRKFIFPAFVFFLVWGIAELDWLQNLKVLHTVSWRFYCLALVFLAIYYLNSALGYVYHNFLVDPYFYICTGCVLYYSVLYGNLTVLGAFLGPELQGAREIFGVLQTIANCLYYLSLCCTFIVCYWNYRRGHLLSTQRSLS